MKRLQQCVIGRIPVLEALRAGKRVARRLFVLQGARDLETILAAAGGLPVEECTREDLDGLAGDTMHQGVVLDATPLAVWALGDWLRQPVPADALVVVLDGIEDPHNFGAIVRTASACGVSAVLFGKDRSAPLSAVAAKAAAGAMEHVALIQVTNIARALDGLKEAGFWVAALAEEAEQRLWDADLKGRIVLVLGNEGHGIRRLVREHCDFLLRIPLPGPIKTLNVSVSAAVALAECVRQRLAKPG